MEAVGDNPRSSSEAVAPRNRKGFSLVEAAIVLGVVGLVIGGIWVAAATIRENRKIDDAVSGVHVISENIRHLYKGLPPNSAGEDLSGQVGWDMGVFKGANGFTFNGTTVEDPFGNRVVAGFTPAATGSLINAGFVALGKDSRCIKITARVTAAFRDTSQLAMVYIQNSSQNVNTFPYIPTAAECNGGNPALERWNAVVFRFNR